MRRCWQKKSDQENSLGIGATIPAVLCRPTQLRELIREIIENAATYLGPQSPHKIQVSATTASNYVNIAIRDNGHGIGERHNEHVFELFRQLDKEQFPGGVGAGLTLARKLARQNGGDVTIATSQTEGPERGTTVLVTLPAA